MDKVPRAASTRLVLFVLMSGLINVLWREVTIRHLGQEIATCATLPVPGGTAAPYMEARKTCHFLSVFAYGSVYRSVQKTRLGPLLLATSCMPTGCRSDRHTPID